MRKDSDEKYVLDLVAEVLKEDYIWQKRFESLLGDPNIKERKAKLPVDAFFPDSNIIVEYREIQHYQSVSIMDKRMTISGVCRGEQRKLYDLRKEQWAADNKITIIIISYADLVHKKNGKLIRAKADDLVRLNDIIKRVGDFS